MVISSQSGVLDDIVDCIDHGSVLCPCQFLYPYDIAVDSSDNVYVTESNNIILNQIITAFKNLTVTVISSQSGVLMALMMVISEVQQV